MIRLRTLGGLSGTMGDAELDWLASHWLRAAVLVHVGVERTVPREKLQAMFWPEDDPDTSSPRLNQIVYGLRQSLGADCLTTKGRNLVAGDHLRADLLDFESAIAAGEHRRAMRLYSGPFLSGIPLS